MVEMEGDIAAVGSQCHQSPLVASQPLGTLADHVLLGVARLIFRDVVDILSRGRTILVHGLDIFRMCLYGVHALCLDTDCPHEG